MKQRDIYYANLSPVKGREQRGLRPVVIISGNAMNDNLEICIICPLTTKIKSYAGCVFINTDRTNKLPQDSEIITFQIRTISKKRLIRRIGEITNEQLKHVIEGLNDILKY